MPAAILVLAVLIASPLSAAPADAEAPLSCLSADEFRHAVSSGRVMQPARALRHAREAEPGEVVRISLCRRDDDYIYVITTLKRDGKVARVTLDGHSGKVSTVR